MRTIPSQGLSESRQVLPSNPLDSPHLNDFSQLNAPGVGDG
jgi:hypothetical protein